MHSGTLCVPSPGPDVEDAERQRRHSHAERGNEIGRANDAHHGRVTDPHPPADRAGRRAGPAAGERLIGAYYYPWYFTERWTREPVTDTPELGRYSSDDREVAARHIEWAKRADLDFFVVSWLSPGGREGKNLAQAVLPELEEARFRFALLYETPLALGLPAGRPHRPLGDVAGRGQGRGPDVEHFDHLADAYLKRECYLRSKARPWCWCTWSGTWSTPARTSRPSGSGWSGAGSSCT
jgi:hypothetical protein